MRYQNHESANQSARTYRPMNNQHRPDYRFPPLRLKHIATTKELRNSLAEQRLSTSGYRWNALLDVWQKDGERDCCVKDGYVLTLTDASRRHIRNP